ncbi:hypothetical protein CCACVL1_30031, partial [Corchorus capsularis]
RFPSSPKLQHCSLSYHDLQPTKLKRTRHYQVAPKGLTQSKETPNRSKPTTNSQSSFFRWNSTQL